MLMFFVVCDATVQFFLELMDIFLVGAYFYDSLLGSTCFYLIALSDANAFSTLLAIRKSVSVSHLSLHLIEHKCEKSYRVYAHFAMKTFFLSVVFVGVNSLRIFLCIALIKYNVSTGLRY